MARGKRRRASSSLAALAGSSVRGMVEEGHGSFQLGERLDAQPLDGEQLGQQPIKQGSLRSLLPPGGRSVQLELDAPQAAERRAAVQHEDAIEGEGRDLRPPLGDRALGPALPKGEDLVEVTPAG